MCSSLSFRGRGPLEGDPHLKPTSGLDVSPGPQTEGISISTIQKLACLIVKGNVTDADQSISILPSQGSDDQMLLLVVKAPEDLLKFTPSGHLFSVKPGLYFLLMWSECWRHKFATNKSLRGQRCDVKFTSNSFRIYIRMKYEPGFKKHPCFIWNRVKWTRWWTSELTSMLASYWKSSGQTLHVKQCEHVHVY